MNNKSLLIVISILLWIATVGLITYTLESFYENRNTYYLANNGYSVTATITDIQVKKGKTKLLIVYSDISSGAFETEVFSPSTALYEKGQEVRIKYDLANPEDAVLTEGLDAQISIFKNNIMLFGGPAFLCLFLALATSSRLGRIKDKVKPPIKKETPHNDDNTIIIEEEKTT